MRQSAQLALIGLACGFTFIFGASQWQEPAPKVRSAQFTEAEQLILSRIQALSGRLDTLGGEIENSTSLLAARLSKTSSLSSVVPNVSPSVPSHVLPSLPAELSPSALPSMEVLLTWRMDDWITYLARRKAAKGERATMLQVGANDGLRNDPLYPTMSKNFSQWVALQVEPATFNYGRLRARHKDRIDWSFAQVVVSNACVKNVTTNESTVIFYEYPQTIAAEDLNTTNMEPTVQRFIQIGQGNGLNYQTHLEKRILPCIDSMEHLIDEYANNAFKKLIQPAGCNHRTLDILQIDAENYDWAIIATVDFKRLRPAIINFEGFGKIELALKQLLEVGGYVTMGKQGMDCLAVDIKSLISMSKNKKCR